MAGQRKLTPKRNALITQLLQTYHPDVKIGCQIIFQLTAY